jgi:hypothetical protein
MGTKMRSDNRKQFEVRNGGIVMSTGRVSEPVELLWNPLGRKKRWFYVLANCAVRFVLGMEFLRKDELLTKNRQLFDSNPAEMSNISSLLWIGSPHNRIKCAIEGWELKE